MELITPNLGLLVWTVLIFLSLLLILSKFAWKPIVSALEEREKFISDSLEAAQRAKEEMATLMAGNEKLLQQARVEKDKILKDAQSMAATILAEAKEKAVVESNQLIEKARVQIQNEKNLAVVELKNLVATTSIEIAEKIIRKNLESTEAQQSLIDVYLKDTVFN
jgi:F-type H+-transporting ATPase subunit b